MSQFINPATNNVILLGPPGCGKGTFSQYLIKHYNYEHICLEDLFRAEIRTETPLGKKIKQIVENGDYVDDEVTLRIVFDKVNQSIIRNQFFIIDGFPRNSFCFHALLKFF